MYIGTNRVPPTPYSKPFQILSSPDAEYQGDTHHSDDVPLATYADAICVIFYDI
jgi:hypothetical protein